jgi:hypothetical protein
VRRSVVWRSAAGVLPEASTARTARL